MSEDEDSGLNPVDMSNVHNFEAPKKNKGGRPKGSTIAAGAKPPGGDKPKVSDLPRDREPPLVSGIPKAPRQKTKQDLAGIVAGFQFGHTLLATRMGDPNWIISEDESYMIIKAGSDLLDYYKIKIDGKNGAVAALIYAISMVYGPRIFAEVMKAKAKNVGPVQQQHVAA